MAGTTAGDLTGGASMTLQQVSSLAIKKNPAFIYMKAGFLHTYLIHELDRL
ncbi:hypothetical protein [Paenibacillus macquariensis]|uniref:Uncharacterized protein n=1 Tax=Paenibacillus macquariensis TaxID=948756 RepID=A0ABY1K3H4_9BACL|nr:hypothetical protein [Paenibacillus macquariensis]MEC0090381.1 hypothetical protein [Paenibacillus macquariensis]SIR20284.1 hypothetical protein SAMN05421578_108209 [Paenibacillus macquariensis]